MPGKKSRQRAEEITAGAGKKSIMGKPLLKNIICMLCIPVSILLAAFGGGLLMKSDLYQMVRNLVFCMLPGLAAVFSFQAGRVSGDLGYDNGEHPGRFLSLYLCGIICAFIFTKLPETGWIFLFFYVALARVSNSITGMCGGISLLVLTASFGGSVSMSVFMAYLLGGLIGTALLACQKDEFYLAVPLGLTLGSQLLLIFAGVLLDQGKKISRKDGLIPLANVIMSGILLFFFLRYYRNRVAEKADDLYMMLNDPEYTVMMQLKETAKEDYYCAIHTAYLAECIASELKLDVRSAKCAAYYGHLPQEKLDKIPFPEQVSVLLPELKEGTKSLRRKEAVVVWICYRLVREIQLIDHKKKISYGKLINTLFEKQFTMEALSESDITLPNLRYIKKRLLKEKTYYELIV